MGFVNCAKGRSQTGSGSTKPNTKQTQLFNRKREERVERRRESDRDDLSVAGVQPFIEEKELEVLEKRHSDLWLNEKRANNLEDSVIEFDEDLASDPLDSEYVPPISLSAGVAIQREGHINHIGMVLLLWTQSKDGIVALADGRMDSPGHSATMQAAEKSSWTCGEVYCTMLVACMSGTWRVAVRQQEIVNSAPPVENVKARWPALYTERQVLAEFNQITSSKLGNDFVEALDCLTTQFIKLFKAKRGSAGAKLSKIVRHLDSCQRRWRKEKGTHQKRWWNCRKTLVTERSLKIIILDMSETHGQMPSRKQKESYALRIITLFSLKDPFSQKGYTNLAS
uniref:Uncharacterized protein n=1 Tax=Knipowitschia caucasica TaxID=637954 RepID=A0AAV2M0F5_KNICA